MLEAVAQDAEHLALLRALGFRSSMIVPLRAGGRVIGDIALVSAGSGRRFGAADLAAAQELADRCGLYLENARLYRELGRARDELEAILAGVADAVTVQDTERPAGLRQRRRGAAARRAAGPRRRCSPPRRAELASRFEMLGEDGRPFPLEQLPGRRALAGEEPEPVTVRYRVRGDRRGALVAREGAADARARRHRDPRDQRRSRTSPTSSRPRRPSGCWPRPGACWPARSTTRRRCAAWRGSRCPTWPTGAWSTCSATAGSSASPSPTPTRRAPSWRAELQGVIIDPTADDRARRPSRAPAAPSCTRVVDEEHLRTHGAQPGATTR